MTTAPTPQQSLAALYDESAAAYDEHWAPALHRHARDLVAAVPRAGGARTVVHAHAAEILEVPVINIGVVRDIDSRADMTNGQGARGNAVS